MNDRELHKLFKKYGTNAREWLRKCALLLPEIERRKIWKKYGCGSIYEYAAKVAGMSHSSVDDALWIMRKIEDKPALIEVARDKGLARVKPVANLATMETEKFWAEKARDMNRDALRVYVRGLKKQGGVGRPVGVKSKQFNRESSWARPRIEPEKLEVSAQLVPELAKRFEQLKKRSDFEALLKEFLDSVEEKEVKEKPEMVKTESRHIPVKIKRFVTKKTGGGCIFPGCNRDGKVFHHTQRFALEKVHDPDRIVLLCEAHERLAHLGLIENEDLLPVEWRLREGADRADDRWLVDQQVWLRR